MDVGSAGLRGAGLCSSPRRFLRITRPRCSTTPKSLELKGAVKELQWANPHIWLQLVVEEKGAAKEWSIEGGSPNTLSRRGWRSTTFKPGDEVTVRVNPMKDGTTAGLFVGAKFADGKTLGRWE